MKKIVYIDLDGVVADFDGAIDKFAIENNLSEDQFESREKFVDRICELNPHIFQDFEPLPGSIEAVKKLFKIFDVYFLSAAMWWVPDCFTGKRIWIEKHFGDLALKRLILTHRKDLNIGDFLVDDSTKNGAGEFVGEHIHFGTEKFPDWDITFKYLESKK